MTIPIITFGQMRDQGVRKVVVYCRNYQCNHHTVTSAERWPDDVRLSDVGPKLICSVWMLASPNKANTTWIFIPSSFWRWQLQPIAPI